MHYDTINMTVLEHENIFLRTINEMYLQNNSSCIVLQSVSLET